MSSSKPECRWVAIGRQLRHVPGVRTLGVRDTLDAYPGPERRLLLSGRKIYYPTLRYANLFHALGIPTFPGWIDHLCLGNKIEQTRIFQALGIPHPRTGVYVGRRAHARIPQDFDFPFVAKTPIYSGEGLGVDLVRDGRDLDRYLSRNRTAYIQEYLPSDRDLRVVVLAGRPVVAYWRIKAAGVFQANLARGGRVSFADVPKDAVALAAETARRCGFDEVGLDLIDAADRYYVIEANFRFGSRGLRAAGIELGGLRSRFLEEGLM